MVVFAMHIRGHRPAKGDLVCARGGGQKPAARRKAAHNIGKDDASFGNENTGLFIESQHPVQPARRDNQFAVERAITNALAGAARDAMLDLWEHTDHGVS